MEMTQCPWLFLNPHQIPNIPVYGAIRKSSLGAVGANFAGKSWEFGKKIEKIRENSLTDKQLREYIVMTPSEVQKVNNAVFHCQDRSFYAFSH